ncbi:MAG: dTMP kinase [Candidatus Altiarchaeales archaeon HGW-Altiarchaeales-3]|nr:MAG: dTMP kinase [Candidatus Altiarchaeales archaeon HGW-Altiarchaeales-3]
MFIVLEGIDGSGKSTHAKLLYNYLKSKRDTILTKEPTNTRIGKFIREILSGEVSVDPKTLCLLFTADRCEHLNSEIIPALNDNKIVICERYYFSTIAYQMAQGVDRDWIMNLNKFALKPDIALFIDVPPEIAVRRVQKRIGHEEIFETQEFLAKIYENYMNFDLIKINGKQDINGVFAEIKDVLRSKIE